MGAVVGEHPRSRWSQQQESEDSETSDLERRFSLVFVDAERMPELLCVI